MHEEANASRLRPLLHPHGGTLAHAGCMAAAAPIPTSQCLRRSPGSPSAAASTCCFPAMAPAFRAPGRASRDAAVRWGVSLAAPGPGPLAIAMSRVTRHLGFGVTYSTTFMHPYYLARLFNSLDHVTGGRIAFNVITSTRRSDFANYGYDDLIDHDERYDRMEEFIDVCRALWNAVEPDAMLWDDDTGMVGDPAKVHDVEHRGRFFKISGPLNTPPSPQGRPVLLQAGSSPRGIRACAYVADMAFGPDMPLDLQIAQRKALDEAVAALGRDPQTMGIVWQQPCVVAETEQEALARRELLLNTIPAGGRWGLSVAQRRIRLLHPAAALHARRTASRDHCQPRLAGRLRPRTCDAARRRHRDHPRGILRLRPAFATSYERTLAGTAAQVADHLEDRIRGDRQPRRLHAGPCRLDARRPGNDRRSSGARTAAPRPLPPRIRRHHFAGQSVRRITGRATGSEVDARSGS